MSSSSIEGAKPDWRRVRGRDLAPGMTLFDAEDKPRENLEISDYREHAHPEVSDYRMAGCPGGWSIMVFDTGLYRISNGTPSDGDGPANEGVST